jgi:hypothetical protein
MKMPSDRYPHFQSHTRDGAKTYRGVGFGTPTALRPLLLTWPPTSS